MVVFSFSPAIPDGFLVSSGDSTSWENCPSDFVEKLEELTTRGDTLLNVSIGCNGGWFLRTSRSNCGNIKLSITFVPDSNGCICIGEASDGITTCLWRGDGVPPSVAAFLGGVPPNNPVQCVSVGSGSSWVVVLQNGAIYSNGISENLKQKLRAAGRVQSVSLSLSNPDEYLINYANGGSDCRLESRWLPAVSAETQKCVLCQSQSIYSAASNAGHAALSAQIMRNRAQASGAAAILDAIW